MSNLLTQGTKVTIKVGDNTGKTGYVWDLHPEDPIRPYDIMVHENSEVWIYGTAEVEPLN